MTVSHTGSGSDPQETPAQSTGCDIGSYVAGEVINLSATPEIGWLVSGWGSTDDDISTALTNSVTMPATAHSVSVAYKEEVPSPICYELTVSHTGLGSDPQATPAQSTGCDIGSYVEGEVISLSAIPDIGWLVSGWGNTDNDTSTALANSVTMPATAYSVSVAYEEEVPPPICYELTVSHTGLGSDPQVTPVQSTGCDISSYVEGEFISLSATPEIGWLVSGWGSTDNDTSTALTNSVTMPAAAHSVSVTYEEPPPTCYTLTVSHIGSGSDPQATPVQSEGCDIGSYVEGEIISLSATPEIGWLVGGWGSTDDDISTELTNSVTMPAVAHSVSVAYEEEISPICYDLTVSHTGLGSDPQATPAQSEGCDIGSYVADEIISLSATPNIGWIVSVWSSTDDDTSTALTNSVTMPATAHSVSVAYEEEIIPPTCYELTVSHTGLGSNPQATPAQSTGCDIGSYIEGEIISLSATPDIGWGVGGWNGTNNDTSPALINSIIMPEMAHDVSVNYLLLGDVCRKLTLMHIRDGGGNPVGTPPNSQGCQVGEYYANAVVQLNASPDSGWTVVGWSGADNDSIPANTNTITMPDSDYNVFVMYGPEVPDTTTRFAWISDSGEVIASRGRPQLVADMVKSWDPAFILTSGDDVHQWPTTMSDSDAIDFRVGKYYQEYIYPYNGCYGSGASESTKFFPTLGNHAWPRAGFVTDPDPVGLTCNHLSDWPYEWYPQSLQPQLDYHVLPGNERYYDFVWGLVHIFVINSEQYEPDGVTSTSVQANWLKDKLATSTSPWKIVVFHRPGISTDGPFASMQWPFREWGASVVFQGHLHYYERLIVDNFPYFVNSLSGGGLAPSLPSTQHPAQEFIYNENWGAVLVEATEDSMTIQFYSVEDEGTLIDSYTIGDPSTTCYNLSTSHTGSGSNLQATPVQSEGCTPGSYLAGESISLSAAPDSGWIVSGWSGTDEDTSTSLTNTITMPAISHSVSVVYKDESLQPGTGTGLRGEYYHGLAFDTFMMTRTDPTVNFNWQSASPDPTMNSDTFSVRWTGQIEAEYSETYTFYTQADDGVRLWINGQLLINDWSNHAEQEKSVQFTLIAGQRYDITVEYYENGGLSVVRLLWASAHQPKEIIPQNWLYPDDVPPACYPLNFTHTGLGSDPQAIPAQSEGCDIGYYVEGEVVSLSATPDIGWIVSGWSSTDDDASTALTNSITMPAIAHNASVTYEEEISSICYELTVSHIGLGSDPQATPAQSIGCDIGSYVESEVISLSATPDIGWVVSAWSSTDDDASTALTNSITMPAIAHNASVTYEEEIPPICYELTVSHIGLGSDPQATPAQSIGCDIGSYVEGEVISLSATPDIDWVVSAWSSTDDDTSTALTNSIMMPAVAYSVSVAYEEEPPPICYELTVRHTGLGSDPQATPAQSTECISGGYVAGEIISLNVTPDSGWMVSGWSSTNDDTSTALTNSITMPATAHSVSVAYEEEPPQPGTGTGLRGEYYHGLAFNTSMMKRTDPTVNFNWQSGSPNPTMNSDTFSVRWTGQIETEYSETYTFYTQADDGVRLWINGHLLINDWSNHAEQEKSVQFTLIAGQRYDIMLEYYENGGLSTVRLLWSSPSQTKEIIPQKWLYPNNVQSVCYPLTRTHIGSGNDPQATPAQSAGCSPGNYVAGESISLNAAPESGWIISAWSNTNNNTSTALMNSVTMPAMAHSVSVAYEEAPPTGTGTGLRGEYYHGLAFNTFMMTRTDPTVNFNWQSGSPNLTMNSDTFSVRWTGQLETEYSETYTFYTQADDGVRLWINGHLLINDWSNHAEQEKSVQFTLIAGQRYNITAEYYENTGLSVVRLLWSSPSQPKEVIPQKWLYPNNVQSVCYPLTRTHIGSGNDPQATPAQSAGCIAGSYVAGESISLNATPDSGWVVSGWSGTNNNTGTASTNSITMPAMAHSVSVTYEEAPPGTGTGLRGEYYHGLAFNTFMMTRTDPTVNFDWQNGSPDSTMNSDTFSVRWTGQIEAEYSETYTFYTQADDGVRLWINGQLLINDWSNHAEQEKSVQFTLIAGQRYDIMLEYYENGGRSVVRLLWSSPSQPKEIIPQNWLYPDSDSSGNGTGLRGEYYHGLAFNTLMTTRTDPAVNFNWQSGSPDPAMNSDTFSVRWTGQIETEYSETYTFYTQADDGVRLWINGQLLINDWSNHAEQEKSVQFTLLAGQRYDIKVEYYENTGLSVARLLWSSPSQPKEVIPQNWLYPD